MNCGKIDEHGEAVVDLSQLFPEVTFGLHVQLIGIRSIRIGQGSLIGDDSWLNVCERDGESHLVIGEKVCIGRHSMLSVADHLEIGSFCLFAPRVYLADVGHAFDRPHIPVVEQGLFRHGGLTVEENCWLGINAVITGGITVGRGSVVAANSVVLDTVPPFCVVAGTPAKIIKMFDPKKSMWVRIRQEIDIAEIEASRQEFILPDRPAYLNILRSNSRIERIYPEIAGNEQHLY